MRTTALQRWHMTADTKYEYEVVMWCAQNKIRHTLEPGMGGTFLRYDVVRSSSSRLLTYWRLVVRHPNSQKCTNWHSAAPSNLHLVEGRSMVQRNGQTKKAQIWLLQKWIQTPAAGLLEWLAGLFPTCCIVSELCNYSTRLTAAKCVFMCVCVYVYLCIYIIW